MLSENRITPAELSTEAPPSHAIATDFEGLKLIVNKSGNKKCIRCWHHRHDVGTHVAHPELCGRCIDNIDGQGEVRIYA